MAFSIFSKPQASPSASGQVGARSPAPKPVPAKKPLPLRNGSVADIGRNNPPSKFTVTRYGSATERARAAAADRQKPSLELGPANLGFSPALENAALLFASGQAAAARQVLGAAIAEELDSRALAMAWHAQFDLLQRANDRPAFDKLALEYVDCFERSPPPWVEGRGQSVKSNAPAIGYFALTEVSVKSVLEIPGRAARYASLRVDVVGLMNFEETGCRRLVDVLRRLRRQAYPVGWQGVDQLWPRIAKKLVRGTAQNEGIWLLALEVLQWQNRQAEFEEHAVDYAITFEVSPPSWEPLATKQQQERAAVEAQPARSDSYALKGTMQGPADAQISALYDFAEPRKVVQIDLSQVERLDFVCAGSVQNAVSNFEAKEKEVQIVGATPIIQSLLCLIGVKPESFKARAG